MENVFKIGQVVIYDKRLAVVRSVSGRKTTIRFISSDEEKKVLHSCLATPQVFRVLDQGKIQLLVHFGRSLYFFIDEKLHLQSEVPVLLPEGAVEPLITIKTEELKEGDIVLLVGNSWENSAIARVVGDGCISILSSIGVKEPSKMYFICHGKL